MNQERRSLFDLSLMFSQDILSINTTLNYFISLLNYISLLEINKCLLWKSGQLRDGQRGLTGKYKSLITFRPDYLCYVLPLVIQSRIHHFLAHWGPAYFLLWLLFCTLTCGITWPHKCLQT